MTKFKTIQATGAVTGVARGYLHFLGRDIQKEMALYQQQDSTLEIQRFYDARSATAARTDKLAETLRGEQQDEQAAILEAQSLILLDTYFESLVREKIEVLGLSAPEAVLQSCEEMAAPILALDDAYLRERANDIKNAGTQIAEMLLGIEETKLKAPAILFGEEIDPSLIIGLSQEAAGFIIKSASITSHAVILARSRGIPTLVGLEDLRGQIPDNTPVILDGGEGLLIVNPDEQTIRNYQLKIEAQEKKKQEYRRLASVGASTKDGFKVTLAANIGYPEELLQASQYGYEGVGLFRTEFLFLGKSTLPTEEDQFFVYRRVIERCQNHRCIIRTMDIGGDKPLDCLEIPPEQNPFLGWRAIRISLKRVDLFLTQLRAILRAGIYGKAAIMLPMVASLAELRQAKQLIAQAMQSLEEEKIPFARDIEVGIMIETPAAAIMAAQFAKECDFFSIGTNDLTQYTLAVDRGNPLVCQLYSYFHPAVLRLIHQVILAAHSQGKWVGMCGEMAGDPAAVRLLCSWGIDELSMSLPLIPLVKQAILACETDRHWADAVLALSETDQVKTYLE
ncbi:phosphoenolpyruvate--protein phosphotransferase [Oscillospiraceae bacterium LTW-04]|nr:phosphoenolpyruvate--protein phosphotransferase [Oscillospiraceae bacterium MB24-C1]